MARCRSDCGRSRATMAIVTFQWSGTARSRTISFLQRPLCLRVCALVRLSTVLFIGLTGVLAGRVHAQPYPDRPIRMIVPFAPGGPVVVDNRGGAGGIVGTGVVARSPGDGYTLLMHSAAITYDPTLHDKLPYDTLNDLAPVAMIGATPNLLVVAPSFPALSVTGLIGRGREKPLTFATGGFGSSSHLAVTLFSHMADVKFNHIPYKGAGPALADVVAGHVDFTLATMPGAIQQVRAGSLRALGISSLMRSPELPAVPTIAEAGLPGYEYLAWFGVFAPGTTPSALVARINALLRQAMEAPDTQTQLRQQGVEPGPLSPDQFRDKVNSEIERWAPVIIKSRMKALP